MKDYGMIGHNPGTYRLDSEWPWSKSKGHSCFCAWIRSKLCWRIATKFI